MIELSKEISDLDIPAENTDKMNAKGQQSHKEEEDISVDDNMESNKGSNNPWKRVIKKFKSNSSFQQNLDEEQFNCSQCDFQATQKDQLMKHINLKHVRVRNAKDMFIECKYCGKDFKEKRKFMTHRKTEHPGSIAFCKNYAAGDCEFSSDACWWSHREQTDKGCLACFICSKEFKTKTEIMQHRKRNHPKVVRICEKFKENACRYTNTSCWWQHEMDTVNKSDENTIDDEVIEEECNPQSVFRTTSWNLKPPFQNIQKKQKTE